MPPSLSKLVFARFTGDGLANELIVLAKAYLASNALGFQLVRPSWRSNRRGYGRYFYHTPLGGLGDRLARRVISALTFDEDAYRATALVDYGEAVLAWASANGLMKRRQVAIECEGMWGGLIALDRSREFIRGTLLGTRFTQSNITDFLSRRDPLKLLVGVHVRRGDFAPPPDDRGSLRGRWNTAIALEWYVKACEALAHELGDHVQFAVFSDASQRELMPLIGLLNALTVFDQRHTDCSDLLLMSLCDVLVCSSSSYSLLAAWLSGRPYIWPAEQCWLEDGWFSLWGHERWQRPPSGLTSRNTTELSLGDRPTACRGLPVDSRGVIPQPLFVHLKTLLALNDRRTDLVFYGAVPSSDA